MTPLLRQEWLKLRTLRSTWWAAAVAVLLTALIAWVAGQAVRLGEGTATETMTPVDVLSFMLRTNIPALIALGAVGAAAVVSDVRHGVIIPTMLQCPRRHTIWLAKAAVVAVIAAATAVAGLLATVAVLATSAGGLGGRSSTFALFAPAAGYVALAVGWALIGLGAGAIIPNQAAAVALVVIVPNVVEPGVRGALTATANGTAAWLAEAMPFGAGSAMIAPLSGASDVFFVGRQFPTLASAAIFFGFTALVMLAGFQAFCRRDVA